MTPSEMGDALLLDEYARYYRLPNAGPALAEVRDEILRRMNSPKHQNDASGKHGKNCGFDVARNIASWMPERDREYAMRAIAEAEKREQ